MGCHKWCDWEACPHLLSNPKLTCRRSVQSLMTVSISVGEGLRASAYRCNTLCSQTWLYPE